MIRDERGHFPEDLRLEPMTIRRWLDGWRMRIGDALDRHVFTLPFFGGPR